MQGSLLALGVATALVLTGLEFSASASDSAPSASPAVSGQAVAGARAQTQGTTAVAPSRPASFHGSAVPRHRLSTTRKSVELGMRFRVTAPGSVTAIRFFKAQGNSGRHTGSLWTSAGKRLARVTFTDETASGWQQASLSRPVPLRPGRVYVVSYHAPGGRYAVKPGYFTKVRTSGTVRAVRGGNGVFRVGRDVRLPRSVSRRASSYFVDVEFRRTTAGVAGTPVVITPPPDPRLASARGCVVVPSSCGFPDATNTGVPAGTVLKRIPQDVTSGAGWHWDSRGWVEIDGDGAVFSGYSTTSDVSVSGDNVTIRNSRISVAGEGFGIAIRHAKNTVIEDTTILSPGTRLMVGIKTIYGDETGTTVRRVDIANTSTGVQIDSGLIEDSYIHDMGYQSGDHINGTTSNGGSSLLTIRHNTILNRFDQTDAVSLFQDFGNQTNRVIDGNLLAGGGYTIYGGANPGGLKTSGIRITNNRISNLYYPRGGSYGPVTAFDPSGSGNAWSGNVWDHDGSTLNP